jgi:hypothetical protein
MKSQFSAAYVTFKKTQKKKNLDDFFFFFFFEGIFLGLSQNINIKKNSPLNEKSENNWIRFFYLQILHAPFKVGNLSCVFNGEVCYKNTQYLGLCYNKV